jgi:hypothetical protein
LNGNSPSREDWQYQIINKRKSGVSKMPKFQVFDLRNPRLAPVAIIEAGSHEEARGRARSMNWNYAAAPWRERESGSLQTVQLREDAGGSGAEDMEHYRALLQISQSFNPGMPDEFHSEFVRGRASSGAPLEDLGRALGLNGPQLKQFVKGRG